MKILVDDKEYEIMADQSAICKSLNLMLPLTMKLSRSGGHEYYASLPQELKLDVILAECKMANTDILVLTETYLKYANGELDELEPAVADLIKEGIIYDE